MQGYGTDYLVTDAEGRTVAVSSPGLNTDYVYDYIHKDYSVDILEDGKVLGRIIFINNGEDDFKRKVGVWALAFLAIFLLKDILAVFYLWKHIFDPVKRMNDFAGQIARGNLDIPVDCSASFGAFSESFDIMREELLYANPYELRRGMEIDQDGLYFCGSFEAGGQEENSARIYRMNLATYEVEDVLALFSQMYDALYDITVIDGKLYVTSGYVGTKLGFELDEDGRAVKTLDADAEDFLYKEDNDYWELLQKVYNNEVAIGSEEYEELMEKANGMYRGVIDLAASQKMLNENQVVMKYKDELLSSIYLKKPDGNYEFLCDTIAAYPVLVTETGVYYLPDERSSIWYVDYETQTRQKIWEEDGRERKEIQLANYDRDYLYFTSKRYLGRDQEGISVHEVYLMRVPRWGEGKAEKVYRFETDKNIGSLYRKCAVAKGKMFFEDYGTISLDPYANGMGPENSGELSEDGMAMRQIIEAFAEAYFKNDEEALRGYLAEGFEGNPDFYPYPERAEEIEELYLSGVPEGNVPVGVVCYVSYEFSGNMEMDDAYSYLSMEVEKTGQGWKILSYGLEG